MPSSGFTIYQNFDFSGGLNIKNKTAEIAPNECVLSQNWVANGKGIEVLPGYTKFNPAPIPSEVTEPVKSMFRFIKPSDTSIKRLIINCGGGLWVADEVNRTFTSLIQSLNRQAVFDFANFGDDYCFMANGYDGIKKYNGTSVYNLQNAPEGIAVSAHFNRLMVGGNPLSPSRLYFSEAGVPDSFDMANSYQELPSVSGDGITKIVFFIDGSIVFKHNSIWYIAGNLEPFPVSSISETIGCPAPKSVVSYGDKLFFFSNTRHIYCYDRANLINLSENLIGEIPVTKSKFKDVCAQVIDGKLWVSFCDEQSNSSYNNRLFTCDISNPSYPKWFGPHKGFNISSFCHLNGYNDNADVFFGDANTSTVWRKGDNYYFGADYEGTVISAGDSSLSISAKGNAVAQNNLAGCQISLTGGTGAGQERIIVGNDELSQTGELISGEITVDFSWDVAPDTTTIWEIGGIDAKLRTGILSFQAPERQKLFDKIFVHTESKGDYPLIVEVVKNHLDSGNQYSYPLLGGSTVWDSAIFEQSVFASQDMLDNYVDLDFENAKYLNIDFSVSGRNHPALLYGFIVLYILDDMLNFDGT